MIRSMITAALATAALATLSIGCAAAPEETESQDDEMKVATDNDENIEPSAGMNCACPAGQVFDNGLCFPACASGYAGVGPVCWQRCASGFSDDGAFCRRNSSIISANTSKCPWYDKCGIAAKKGCSTCPSGYSNDGCTCRRDAYIYAKPSYGRGAGSVPTCSSY